MTTWEHIETLLPQLTPDERARLASLVAPAHIRHTPGVNGGSANVGQTRIAVWMLESARREGLNDSGILEMYPGLSTDDLEEAWRFVTVNASEIEREIEENEKA